ncbi:MAG TPA: DNA-3-methyladenine glycosylase [Saprospiraceae bacterium]|nr:DNA-3-methyladenine glycosylase [Saprospiraceae bacterium]
MKVRLPRKFYTGDDVVSNAQALLGKILCTCIDGILTSGIIVETEAYHGPEDKASHAYNGCRTARTEIMYSQGGTAYIYLCYGIHHLFNVVTATKDVPHAILIRAIEPLEGIDLMLQRRDLSSLHHRLTAGPGALSMALGIHTGLSGTDLLHKNSPIWIDDRGTTVTSRQIIASHRVGVNYAGEWAQMPWRFRIKGNSWVSRAQ